MSAVKKPFWSELEQRELFGEDSGITTEEAFEMLESHGINYIAWDGNINACYMRWLFLHVK